MSVFDKLFIKDGTKTNIYYLYSDPFVISCNNVCLEMINNTKLTVFFFFARKTLELFHLYLFVRFFFLGCFPIGSMNSVTKLQSKVEMKQWINRKLIFKYLNKRTGDRCQHVISYAIVNRNGITIQERKELTLTPHFKRALMATFQK